MLYVSVAIGQNRILPGFSIFFPISPLFNLKLCEVSAW
jgi:hypothetical protein